MSWLAQCSKISSAACLAATLLLARGALARGAGDVEDWLTWTGSARCSSDPRALAARILAAAVGTPNQELGVDVTLADGAADTVAVVRLRLGAEVMGTKRLVAPACADALSAVVAVVALALSSERAEAEGRSSSPEPVQTPVGAALVRGRGGEPRREARGASAPSSSAVSPSVDRGVTLGEPASGASRFRVLVAGGVDTGTLDEPTAVAGAGAALNIGRGELRAVVWYGLPAYREEVSDRFESERVDFAAAALGYCAGLDAARWLSICGGLELGLERSSRVEQVGDQPRTERERIEPSLGAVAGLALAYRELPLSPQLEASAHVPLAPELILAPPLGFRLALSASVQF